jgi:uncharacterized protein with HEPN domain
MPEDEVLDVLDLILESIRLIRDRFSRIRVPDDFVSTSEGVTLLDAISMRLQVIGESVKQIQKVNPMFLQPYSEIGWDKIARFRDLISHHYEHVDHEVVYDICKVHIPMLADVVERMRMAYLESGSSQSQ